MIPKIKIKHELYGDAEGQTANQLYKKYSAWANANGKEPLVFTSWLDWAKSKGLVEDMEEEAQDEMPDEMQDETPVGENQAIKKVKNNTGKILIFTGLALITISIIISLTRTTK